MLAALNDMTAKLEEPSPQVHKEEKNIYTDNAELNMNTILRRGYIISNNLDPYLYTILRE